MHSEKPDLSPQSIRSMPTDADIDRLYEIYASNQKETDVPPRWGDGLVWGELHHTSPYPYLTE